MDFFILPPSSLVNRVVPKNAFDPYTGTKEKKEFVEKVDKIRWTHKLSHDTTNLPVLTLHEIQVFEITLRARDPVSQLLRVIDRAIPYPLIFILVFGEECMVSASQKHEHPAEQDNAVIDWTFTSDWLSVHRFPYQLELKKDLDYVFSNFCKQISSRKNESKKLSVEELILLEKKEKELKTAIQRLESAIGRTKQFNKKVELNMELRKKQAELSTLRHQ